MVIIDRGGCWIKIGCGSRMLLGLTLIGIQKNRSMSKSSFRHARPVQFPWLCFSETRSDGFSTHCALFAEHHLSFDQLVMTAMTDFTHAKVTLQGYSKQSSHKMASVDTIDITSPMKKRNLSEHSIH